MNITVYVLARDGADLDHMAKAALLMVASHADYPATTAEVSIATLAANLVVNYATARRALGRALDAGWLTVQNRPGLSPIWDVTPRAARGVTPRDDDRNPARYARGDRALRAGLAVEANCLALLAIEGFSGAGALEPVATGDNSAAACLEEARQSLAANVEQQAASRAARRRARR